MVGRALRALRLRAGLKQEELASRGATNATYISLIENGHRGLRWHTIMRLLRAMNMTAGDLGAEVDEQERFTRAEVPERPKRLRG
jgi:transcriptional regulator with XRE-family HTH domain